MSASHTNPANLPPHDIEAEMSILGGMLLGNEARTLEALNILTGEDFYRDAHGSIFEAARRVVDRGEPLDIITLHAALPDVGVGMDYLLQLSEFVPSPASIVHYAKIVRENATLRRLRELAAETYASAGRDGGASDKVIADIERRILSLRPPEERKQTRKLSELIRVVNDRFEEREHSGGNVSGISTGFDDLDFYTAGLQRGDLIIIAARSSMGKTILGMNIARNVAGEGLVSAVFSLEMPGEAVTERLVAAQSSVSAHARRTGMLTWDDWKAIEQAGSILYDLPMVIDDNSSTTPAYIRSKCKMIKAEYGGRLDLIVVDYLGLMNMGSSNNAENRNIEIGNITKSLKAMAREFDCPLILLCQISRNVERREDKRPMLSDLRDSGNIEQDADVVLGIYRASYYARQAAKASDPPPSTSDDSTTLTDEAEILILKQRNGPVGVSVKLGYEGRFFRFTNLPTAPEGAPDF